MTPLKRLEAAMARLARVATEGADVIADVLGRTDNEPGDR